MFKVNKLTDYATVVLIEIARGTVVRSSQHLSERTGIPLPTVAKIMKNLNKAGLVCSQRGAGGGYALGRKPADISIADVIQAVEGPIALTACADTSDEHCGIELVCPVQGKWNRVNTAVRAALAEVTLADMAEEVAAFGLHPRRVASQAAPFDTAAVEAGVK
ncbi:MAG: SUF system Fe-S cluster assembly regulator [Rhodospirillaceae bacterium]|nr:SUF system Fe-S cluster assembly regulator [Rhodospirillaceae bacterium]